MTDIVEYCVERLPAVLSVLASSDVELLEVQDGETRLRVHRTPGPAIEAGEEPVDLEPLAPGDPVLAYITSPLVGTFYRASKPGAAHLADEGTEVEDESVVGFIEVLGESIEVQAGKAGRIVEVLATDGDAVDYGHALFAVTQDE